MEKQAKLLIIDDEEIVLDSCIQILAEYPYQIATANDGIQGLDLCQEYQPDVVFVDLKMPGMSGFEVIERIRECDPTIVTIVITGFATVGSAVEAMKIGAYDFLPKPFTPDELRLIARRGIEKRNLILETIALRREKEMLRDHFAAIVSHELKSPLSSVQQNFYVMKNDLASKLDEDQLRRFDRIQTRIDDLVKLIESWLRVISVDITKIQDNFVPVSVITAITKAIESLQSQASRKDIDIVLSPVEPTRLIDGDEGTIVEALVNIIGNAIKYSRVGSKISIQAEDVGEEVRITIVDTGVGISAEDLPHIFDDFYMGKPAPSGEKSSGLGLAITRRIVEAHHGEINVESELGKGSKFVLHFPGIK